MLLNTWLQSNPSNRQRKQVTTKNRVMHENGIIHRNVTKDNIWLNIEKGKIKDTFILDFYAAMDVISSEVRVH
jgi:tRNA A-37 threonylcarbamoyl transferase component Bud32